MDYISLVLLIVIHVIFDFFLQDRDTAKNKSSNFRYLIPHLFILSVGLTIYCIISPRYNINQSFYFVYSNVILHGIIDWNIWKLYKYLANRSISKGKKLHLVNQDYEEKFKYWEDTMFYNFIAIDQTLHSLCYLLTDYLIRLLA